MIRIGPFSNALLGLIGFSGFLAVLLPSAAQAACLQWDMAGSWDFVQSSNAKTLGFELVYRSGQVMFEKGKDPGLVGRVSYTHRSGWGGAYGGVTGALYGNSLELTATWQDGTISVYKGTIDPQGRIQGTAHYTNPTSTTSWYSKQTAKCLPGAGAGEVSPSQITPRAVIPPPVIKAQPRVKPGTQPGTVNPPLTICESARQARARNSPAAPGLEASCRAAGGTP